MVKKSTTKNDPLVGVITPLLGKLLQGTATPEEIEQLNKASKEFLAAETGVAKKESERFLMAEQIMDMLVDEGSDFSTSEAAELRHIFFRSDNPLKTLGAMRKIRDLA